MEKIRLTDRYDDLFHATKIPAIIEVPTLPYISINGKGSLFKNKSYDTAIGLLQGIAFFTKFKLKQNPPPGFVDYRLTPFEAVWGNTDLPKEERTRKVMLLQPEFVTKQDTERAYLTAKQKQEKEDVVTLPKMAFQKVSGGKCIQILHTGSYFSQEESIKQLHEAAEKA